MYLHRQNPIHNRLIGLSELLTEVYETETELEDLLSSFGFTERQVVTLVEQYGEILLDSFISYLSERLSNNNTEKRMFHIICQRYGLDISFAESLQAIGDRLGITRERVRQIQVQAVKRLKTEATKTFWEESLKRKASNLLGV